MVTAVIQEIAPEAHGIHIESADGRESVRQLGNVELQRVPGDRHLRTVSEKVRVGIQRKRQRIPGIESGNKLEAAGPVIQARVLDNLLEFGHGTKAVGLGRSLERNHLPNGPFLQGFHRPLIVVDQRLPRERIDLPLAHNGVRQNIGVALDGVVDPVLGRPIG